MLAHLLHRRLVDRHVDGIVAAGIDLAGEQQRELVGGLDDEEFDLVVIDAVDLGDGTQCGTHRVAGIRTEEQTAEVKYLSSMSYSVDRLTYKTLLHKQHH